MLNNHKKWWCPRTELEFYGINSKKNTCLSDDDINIHIAETFKEVDDEEYSDEQTSQTSAYRLTTTGGWNNIYLKTIVV